MLLRKTANPSLSTKYSCIVGKLGSYSYTLIVDLVMSQLRTLDCCLLVKSVSSLVLTFWPQIGLMINTTSSNTPNTRPYSAAVDPFFSACAHSSTLKLKPLYSTYQTILFYSTYFQILTSQLNYVKRNWCDHIKIRCKLVKEYLFEVPKKLTDDTKCQSVRLFFVLLSLFGLKSSRKNTKPYC